MNPSPHLSAPAPRHLIGIDGGGSGTRARLADAQGRTLALGEAGPSGLAQGVPQAWRHVRQAIDAAFAAAGLPGVAPQHCALGLGLAGVHAPALAAAFRAADPGFQSTLLDTDAGVLLLGAHGGQPGVIVAAGTGSVGEALRRDGRRLSVGGWGFPVGDEGSGAWLGLRAMQLSQQAMDGRGPVGALARAVWERVGGQRDQLIDWCAGAGQQAYASLAPLVFELAHADPVAWSLLDEAAQALARLVDAMDPLGELPIVVGGSVGQRLAPRLPARLHTRSVPAQADATEGALHLLRSALGQATVEAP
ncbi:BadF/BadG/BcrA/BcrD ATPase family protein [Aquabacterium sp. OR-4]|uniref:BadF/BadG/BcrA/BcrD ATPase family protein n=1 Tax=Aquabacterium sp. OR-4 TaxID=2978127 RepID=UPI0021B4CAC5|nr:BadF/BadG/BcrA/BcrD ATPase family protein [Aquabacterium sp. OR-4]MDT7836602.1 BadF/BadG/BcrA/BcrD ATPase family protein [Aquabacterium sp. OR-4]